MHGDELSTAARIDFIHAQTAVTTTPLVPEVRLRLAAEAIELWERIEHSSGRSDTPPPFWAFPWAGGQALARHVLDHPELLAGRRVLDLASGSGLVAIAAALAGAADVVASDIDHLAVAVIGLNAAINEVAVTASPADLLDGDGLGAQVVLAGDVFYERPMAARVLPMLARAQARGALVLVGDPGRMYLPRSRFDALADYEVPVVAALEDTAVKRTTVWRMAAEPS
ncbi:MULTISPECIES: class I SAM-dependent methyltransferase [Actinoalloteichus]|uniref:Methyltransferase n=1 Tax=Actinoalloteichus fjordicus TaxID=1612552 RepID=A0AAC9LBG1_9PSEU|nr:MULTISPECIES: 50S ribosomal protein L11 methyltransferase [Actinoalloteichus]APU14853.1 putative methyltransferase [Actinoalloteichus fjordicus]APU20822.1 putative methyltransferase [Actinoalloteichus sp. GBA129-24]